MAVAIMQEIIEDEQQEPQLPAPPDIAIDVVRYVACLGDFIVPGDKAQLRGLGSRAGGYRVGVHDIGGCPTMWRKKGMILRGQFTPLEKTVIGAHVDERRDKGEMEDATPIGERMKYPASDITYLTDGDFFKMGFTELTALRGHEWADEFAKDMNLHFFPDFNLWRQGEKPFPTFLRIYEDFIGSADILTEEQNTTQLELLDSVRRTRTWMIDQIEFNRARIQSTRNVDMGGASFKWSAQSRLFAEQLEITLERENDVAPAPKAVVTQTDERYIAAMEEQNRLKARELELMEKSKTVEPPFIPPTVATAPPVTSTVAKCSAITANDTQCQRDAVENGRCALPAHRIVAVPITEEE